MSSYKHVLKTTLGKIFEIADIGHVKLTMTKSEYDLYDLKINDIVSLSDDYHEV
jgi:hypothetical protein